MAMVEATAVIRALLSSAVLCAFAGCEIEYVVPMDTGATTTGSSTDSETDPTETSGTCEAPMLACGDACVDPDSDPQHCGECGEDCGPGGSCVAGDCIDACGDACDRYTEVCAVGTCMCRVGFTACGDTCVDLQTNASFCGECDEDCLDEPGETYVCETGQCYEDVECSPGLTQCGQSCVDVQTHPLHCDECDRACDGDEVCIDGDCEDL